MTTHAAESHAMPANGAREPALTADREKGLRAEITFLQEQVRLQEKQIQDLKSLALLDPLTELPNRRAFEQMLDQSLAEYRRYQREGALVVIDVNGFKQVNDTLGHQAGDALLKHITSLLKEHTRQSDFVARVGGDEFAIILKEMESRNLAIKLKQLAMVVSSTPCRLGSRDIAVSISLGACTFSQTQDSSTLYAYADAAMYRDKHATPEHV
jgi:diguanylate cyclase (GGDEF)-like protein